MGSRGWIFAGLFLLGCEPGWIDNPGGFSVMPGTGTGRGDKSGAPAIQRFHGQQSGCGGGQFCGTQSPDGCSCAPGCRDAGTCCADFAPVCEKRRSTLKFMDACAVGYDTCYADGGETCRMYGQRGSYCSRACPPGSEKTHCPSPSRGCSTHGFCRSP